MLLTAKKLALLGLLLAITVLLVVLSGIIEFNTLFLLAGASFCVGVAIREGGIRMGFGFYIASIFLSLYLAPNKLYIITYGAMALYIVISEYALDKLVNVRRKWNRRKSLWLTKYLIFNAMYVPILIFFPKLIYQEPMNEGLFLVVFIGGQIMLFLFDCAYVYFQTYLWGRLRRRLNLR